MDPAKRQDSDQPTRDGASEAEVKKEPTTNDVAGALQVPYPGSQVHSDVHGSDPQRPPVPHGSVETVSAYPIRQPWEYIDEVVQILKTASPLLILSMETMVDQIGQRFKPTPEEDLYRLVCMLLQDAMQVSTQLWRCLPLTEGF
jgi:transformation/transcription domain-associated protein